MGCNKGNKGTGKGGKGGKQAAAPQQKNWRCEVCANTDNCAWWAECSRPSCRAAKPEPKPQSETQERWSNWNYWSPSGWVDYQEEPKPPEELLRAARDNLKAVAAIFPAGHAAVTEVAAKVAALEEAQKVSVPKSEKLRRLLQAQKELEAKQTESVGLVTQAAEDVRTSTTALKAQMEWREEVERDLATNKLDVAALSRDVSAQDIVTPGDVVQSLRARVDILADNDFVNGGFVKADLGTFFQGLAKLVAVIDHAEHRAAAVQEAPTATIAATPGAGTEAPATPGAGTGAGAGVGGVGAATEPLDSALGRLREGEATNRGLGFTESEDEDDAGNTADDNTMDDGDTAAQAALESANTLLSESAVWATTLPSTAPSSG